MRRASASTYLGCHEFGSTAEGACSRAIPHVFFTQSIVCDLDVAVKRQQYIVELEITIYDSVLVEVFQCKTHFRGVESVSISNVDITSYGTHCARLVPN